MIIFPILLSETYIDGIYMVLASICRAQQMFNQTKRCLLRNIQINQVVMQIEQMTQTPLPLAIKIASIRIVWMIIVLHSVAVGSMIHPSTAQMHNKSMQWPTMTKSQSLHSQSYQSIRKQRIGIPSTAIDGYHCSVHCWKLSSWCLWTSTMASLAFAWCFWRGSMCTYEMFICMFIESIAIVLICWWFSLRRGTANPAVKPGLAAEFRLIVWLKSIVIRCFGYVFFYQFFSSLGGNKN